ncbi:hypothetical protein ACEQ8H_007323 [Pleosporales sp. CAS-2024a]
MSGSMAPPRARTRLTVEVLPLAADNAHGAHRAHALAAFKGRRFALPVCSDDTFETVWAHIEHRYKTSYLSPQQAATFTIHKLQDAYDCDLFMADTVASIFEGEADPARRVIRVVPAFVDRDFSVPPTSALRPAQLQKRPPTPRGSDARKRRRTSPPAAVDATPAPDLALPSTEHARPASRSPHAPPPARARARTSRSATGSSLVFVHGLETGRREFPPALKQESPDVGVAPPPPSSPQEARPVHSNGASRRTASPPARHHSLEPTSAQRPRTPVRQAARRTDIYDVPSSPEFMLKERTNAKTPKTRYGRDGIHERSELGLLNSSHLRTPATASSTPQPKPGSLKKPARDIFMRNPKADAAQKTSASSPALAVDQPAPTPRARGRPRTTEKSVTAKIPKRRGRPPKNAADATPAPLVRPGRKPSAMSSNTPDAFNEDAVVHEHQKPNDHDAPRSQLEHAPTTNGHSHQRNGQADTEAPWTAQSWNFGSTKRPSATIDTSAATTQVEETQKTPPQAPQDKRDGSEPQMLSPDAPPEGASQSRSASAAASNRSSPVVLRQPARFLSHSPSPNGVASERGSQEPSVSLSKSTSPKHVAEDALSDGTSSSKSHESSTEDDDEVAIEPEVAIPSTAPQHVPSSPPAFNKAPSSMPMVPSTSQPTISQRVRQTPIPLPPNVSRTPFSLQSSATRRPPASRPTSFPTLREQLGLAKTPVNASQKKPYDPRIASLTKLTAKPNGKPTLASGMGHDSSDDDDDESSDSSDSD